MSSAGRAVSSNGCVTKPKGRETGLRGCFVQIRSSLLTGSYVMETAEQREPYESRGSRTVLGEPGGESPPGHSTRRRIRANAPAAGRPQRVASGSGQKPPPALQKRSRKVALWRDATRSHGLQATVGCCPTAARRQD